jgi:hypothetical protein
MARILYSAEKKAEILSAVKQAVRKNGWKGALEVAKATGYKGGEGALQKMYYTKPKRGRKAAGKKPGRPAKTAASAGNDMQSIQKTLDAIVRKRVTTAFDEAIAMLQRAKDKA